MSPQIALLACGLLIGWLLFQDAKAAPGSSRALWLVIAWVFILCTRPVSAWLGQDRDIEAAEDYIEGSAIDRNVFLFLLIAGLFVLWRRRVDWSAFAARNRWLFCFYLFFGVSMIWSDYSFVCFKRWIKDLGNVVMVLIVLTDPDGMAAVRKVFTRTASLVLPLSVLFIKYYPDLGRAYDRWTGKAFYQGATVGKNMLGGTVAILTLFLVWDVLQMRKGAAQTRWKAGFFVSVLLLGMAVWLLVMADSATSVACSVLGTAGLVMLSIPFVQRRAKHLLAYSVIFAITLLIATTLVDVTGGALGMLGRDSSLTGRTDIWKAVLAEKSNPILGTGFYSFWLGSRVDRLWDQYSFRLNQAHNGYLEIYLNGGIIGVGLLLAILVSAGRNINRRLANDTDWQSLRLIIWLIVIIYNWTEASFCRLNVLWFALLLVVVEYGFSAGTGLGGEPEIVPSGEPLGESNDHAGGRPATSVTG